MPKNFHLAKDIHLTGNTDGGVSFGGIQVERNFNSRSFNGWKYTNVGITAVAHGVKSQGYNKVLLDLQMVK
jgi:hypothetical protein